MNGTITEDTCAPPTEKITMTEHDNISTDDDALDEALDALIAIFEVRTADAVLLAPGEGMAMVDGT